MYRAGYRHSSLLWTDPNWRHAGSSRMNRIFQAMLACGSRGEAVGRELLRFSRPLFRWRRRLREETIDRQYFPSMAMQQRREVETTREGDQRCNCAKAAATCLVILTLEQGLLAFARVAEVEPTNNALRIALIWQQTRPLSPPLLMP
jgi:transposase